MQLLDQLRNFKLVTLQRHRKNLRAMLGNIWSQSVFMSSKPIVSCRTEDNELKMANLYL